LHELYLPFIQNGSPIITTSPKAAELIKYGSNGILAIRLSFINQMAKLCDALGVNVQDVLEGMTADKRIGKKFSYPSGGYGGSCFPKDVKALVHTGEQVGVELSLVRTTDIVNNEMKNYLLDKISLYFPKGIKDLTFAVWGLAFKSGTDDAREAPSLTIIDRLLNEGARIKAYDPEATGFVRNKTNIGDRIFYTQTADVALVGADALIICTDWPEFKNPDFESIKSKLKYPVIFDNKSLFRFPDMLEKVSNCGFAYFGVGVENDIARTYRKFGK